jgi:flagellar motor switch protein FliM
MAGDEVLSEGEIDALMERVDDAGDTPASGDDGQYRRFDFSARERSLLAEFTKLPGLLERQGELLAEALADAFALDFLVAPQAPSLTTAADALVGLERHVAVSNTALSPLDGQAFVITPAPLLSFIVNEYFGGSRNTIPDPASRGAPTPSELRLAERLALQVLDSLKTAWVEQIAVDHEGIHTLGVPDRLEALPPKELLLRLDFSLSGGDQSSTLQLLLPFAPLEPFRERFAPPRRGEDKAPKSSWESYFRRELPGISLELCGVLGSRSISLAELLQLETGAVIPLDAPTHVALRVEQNTLAEGRYGRFEGNKAVQIERLAGALGAANR